MGWRSQLEDLHEQYEEYMQDMAEAGRARYVLTFEDWQSAEGERAYERQCADYYGSNAPQTESERKEVNGCD